MDDPGGTARSLIWQMFASNEIDRAGHKHQDARSPEPNVPPVKLRKRPAQKWARSGADIDAGREYGLAMSRPRCVARRIEMADLRRNIALKTSRADNQEKQRQKKARLEHHRQMSRRHQENTDKDGLFRT